MTDRQARLPAPGTLSRRECPNCRSMAAPNRDGHCIECGKYCGIDQQDDLQACGHPKSAVIGTAWCGACSKEEYGDDAVFPSDKQAHADARADGVAAERARIVARLREHLDGDAFGKWSHAADLIERDEHTLTEGEQSAQREEQA